MRLLTLISGYLKFALKQSSTPILLVLYPLFIILLFGIALTLPSDTTFKIGVLGSDGVFNILEQQENLEVLRFQSEAEMIRAIKDKEIIMGIIKNYNKDGSKAFEVLFDTTKKPIVTSLLIQMDNAINEERFKSGKSLTSIQSKLAAKLVEAKERRQQLDTALNELEGIRGEIQGAKTELQNILSSLNAHEQELRKYNSSLSQINSATAKIQSYMDKLDTLYNEATEREQERNQAIVKIDSSLAKLDSYEMKINNALYYVSIAKSYSTSSSLDYYLDKIESDLRDAKNDIITAKADLQNARFTLSSIDFAAMKEDIVSAKLDLFNAKKSLEEFKQASSDKIASLLSEVSEMKNKTTKAIARLEELDQQTETLLEEGEKTKVLIDDLMEIMEDFTGKKPEELLPPSVDNRGVFDDYSTTTTNFPTLMGITMSLGALLLPMLLKIKMRDQGAYMRIRRAGVSSFTVTLSEFISNYLLVIFQALLILAIGLLFFNVSIEDPLKASLIVAMSPIAFTSLGVALSQVVRRTSSAFMVSLLISIPMILISGTVIPLELLARPIQYLGMITPLYVLTDLIEKLSFRELGLIDALPNIIYLCLSSISTFIAAVFLYHFRRE